MHLTGIAALALIVKDDEFGWKPGILPGKRTVSLQVIVIGWFR